MLDCLEGEVSRVGDLVILAIDPGTEKSGVVVYDDQKRMILEAFTETNDMVLNLISARRNCDLFAIEMVEARGQSVGRETFETVFWSGRFWNQWSANDELKNRRRIYRRDVKIHLCGSARATDSNVRYALLDKFGGESVAVGTKKMPGPLYSVKSHAWAALAIAVTAAETETPR